VKHLKFGDIQQIENCPVRDVLDRIGDRWSFLVLWMLDGQTLRFMEIKRGIPDISQRMLTKTLRALEEDGFVQRTIHATIPPKVEYRLTPLGETLLVPAGALIDWATEHHESVRAARRDYAAKTA